MSLEARTRLDQFPLATGPFAGGEFFPIYAGGGTKRATLTDLATFIAPLVAAASPRVDVALATTIDVGAIVPAPKNIRITAGTGPLGSFGTTYASGARINVTAGVAFTMTNSAGLILPGAADIAVAVGDTFQLFRVSTGWQVEFFQRASGAALVAPASLPGGFTNLKITVTSDTAASITADGVAATNGTTVVASGALSLTLGTGTSGANGRDTGAIAPSTWYYLWAIYNPTTLTWACLMSLSATAPTMPSGYTFKVRLGALRTDATASPSSKLVRTIQFGRKAQYVVTGAAPSANLPQMATGTVGSTTVPTWVAVAIAGFVPPTAANIAIMLSATGTNTTAIAAPNNAYGAGASASNPPPLTAINFQAGGSSPAEFAIEGANVYWASNAAAALYCRGWEDNL